MELMAEKMFTEEIERGVEWLNEYDPNWLFKIDLAKLKLESCEVCVLGQCTLEGFNETCMTMSWSWSERWEDEDGGYHDWASCHGFDLDELSDMIHLIVEKLEPDFHRVDMHYYQVMGFYWDQLTDEWGAKVKELLDAGVGIGEDQVL